jgi:hypothetical protein
VGGAGVGGACGVLGGRGGQGDDVIKWMDRLMHSDLALDWNGYDDLYFWTRFLWSRHNDDLRLSTLYHQASILTTDPNALTPAKFCIDRDLHSRRHLWKEVRCSVRVYHEAGPCVSSWLV